MRANLVGTTLGQYRLVEQIGEGGMAVVYKAYQTTLSRWVAVKVLDVAYEETQVRFEREARTVANLRHPNILVVYEYGEDQEYTYIVMELIEHGTLKDRLKGEPLEWGRAIELIIPVAEALHYAHGQGLIHRDVKPTNILMAQEAWPLLADFSLVKIANTDSPLTRSGMVMGTPAYISPEQANGDLVDRRADIYALGVVLFEMITGRLPFVYSNPNMLMLAHISEPVPSPCALNPACPPELERVILTALQKSPDDRYSNMQAMIEAFIYVTGASTVSFSGQSPAKRPFRSTEPSLTKPPARPETSQGPRLVLSTQNVSLELPNPPRAGLILGRSHGSVQADVDLGPYEAAAAGVSRQHARLTHSNQAWFIEDLNSLNGTYVNEVKLTPGRPALLKHGDVVRCSRLSLVFLLPEN